MENRMKKCIAVILSILSVFALAGCGDQEKKIKDVPVSEIAGQVQEAYGDNYVAEYAYTDEDMQNLFGVDPDDCEEYAAYGPLMSGHVDTFLAIKAKADKKDEVKSALEAYQARLKEDTMQYPMNLPKIQASTIKEYDNYIFFIMLGFIDEDDDEEKMKELYSEQNDVAVKVIEDLLYGVQ